MFYFILFHLKFKVKKEQKNTHYVNTFLLKLDKYSNVFRKNALSAYLELNLTTNNIYNLASQLAEGEIAALKRKLVLLEDELESL